MTAEFIFILLLIPVSLSTSSTITLFIEAESYLNQSISSLRALNEYSAICEFLISMSDMNEQRNDIHQAIKQATQSLELSTTYQLKKEMSEANRTLSRLYEIDGDPVKSLFHFKTFITYRDSVNNIEGIQKVADLRTDFEVSKKQKEVDLLATKNKLRIAERNGFVFATLWLATFLVISIYYYSQRVKRNRMRASHKMQEAEINHQKNLIQSVITSQEAERKRIGMDLHDEVGAALSTLRLSIDQNPSSSTNTTQKYKSDIDKIIANMSNISHVLSPRLAGNYGFYDAVHELSDSVNHSDKISMLVQFDENRLPDFNDDHTPMALYRIISELINNTLKHAQAHHIHLDIDVIHHELSLKNKDDGVGFLQNASNHSSGMGIQNIESRLGVIGATWQIQTSPGNGYSMSLTLPIK